MVAYPGVTLLRQAGIAVVALLFAGCALPLRAAEYLTLRSGSDMICDHREVMGDHIRLYLNATGSNFVDVGTAEIVSSEQVTLPVVAPPAPDAPSPTVAQSSTPSSADMHALLARAGSAHDLDVELLASVIRAESGGNARAVSRTGARGLMQLMPGTASQLGVQDSFRADQNIDGGTTYLNALLIKYHDNLQWALAAYNAGPAAVDRYHGIPPYRETRAYVARIIRDFNRRKLAAAHAAHLSANTLVASSIVPAGK